MLLLVSSMNHDVTEGDCALPSAAGTVNGGAVTSSSLTTTSSSMALRLTESKEASTPKPLVTSIEMDASSMDAPETVKRSSNKATVVVPSSR